MSWPQGIDLARMFRLVVETVETISLLTRTTRDDDAARVLKSIGEAVAILKSGVAGKISVEAADAALADLRARLTTNDDTADIKLAEKFDQGD